MMLAKREQPEAVAMRYPDARDIIPQHQQK